MKDLDQYLMMGGVAVAFFAIAWGCVNKAPTLRPAALFLVGLLIGCIGDLHYRSYHPSVDTEEGMRRILREELRAQCPRTTGDR